MSLFYTNVERLGNDILVIGFDTESKKRFQKKIQYSPVLYQQDLGNPNSKYKSLTGIPLRERKFDNMKDMTEFVYSTRDVPGMTVFGMRDAVYQFTSEYFPGDIVHDEELITGVIIDIEVFSGDIDSEGNAIAGPFPEPDDAAYPVVAITAYSTKEKKYYVFGLNKFKGHELGTWEPSEETAHLDIEYFEFPDERSLMQNFIKLWSGLQPDWYSGWNSDTFDMHYLVTRMKRILGERAHYALSPWNFVRARSYNDMYGKQTEQIIYGVSCLDMMALYKKHGFIQPVDWKLGTVATMELGVGKIDYSEASSLNTLYVKNYSKYINYNIIDVDLVKRMNDKRKFYELTYTIAYLTKSRYADTFATIVPWYSLLYDMLRKDNRFPEITSPPQDVGSIPGGFVMQPILGKHKWVVNGDLASLYPHLMQQYNLGPETIIPLDQLPQSIKDIPDFTFDDLLNQRVDLSALKDHDIIMTANRQFFRKNRLSCFSEATRKIYNDRKAIRKEMRKMQQEYEKTHDAGLQTLLSAMDSKQLALKILINGLYGATTAKYFTGFFDQRIATAITLGGQLSITFIAKRLNDMLNKVLKTGEMNVRYTRDANGDVNLEWTGNGVQYVIYCDTDSVFLNMEEIVNKKFTAEEQKDWNAVTDFLDELFRKQIEPYIEKCYDELAQYMNAYENRMFMEREKISISAVWNGKKRYTMLNTDVEGVRFEDPHMHITGLEAVRGTTPEPCRKWLSDMYRVVLENDDETVLHKKVQEIKAEFMKQTPEDIASPRTANNIDKYADPVTIFVKGTPMHVRSVLFHNKLVKDLKLSVDLINTGEKVMTVPLTRNKYQFDVIGFQNYLPKEFDLHKHVDYNVAYKKGFEDAAVNFLRPIGWDIEPKASVLDFFT